MLARTIHILLIPAILGCPLFCTGGAGGVFANCCERNDAPAETEHERPAPCCTAHADDFERNSPEDPAPADEEPADHSCQCICGGAILGDAPLDHELRHAPLALGALALPTSILNLPQLDDSTATQLLRLIGDRTAVSGRHLRQLYMSLLC
jgi:hypothetical protein